MTELVKHVRHAPHALVCLALLLRQAQMLITTCCIRLLCIMLLHSSTQPAVCTLCTLYTLRRMLYSSTITCRLQANSRSPTLVKSDSLKHTPHEATQADRQQQQTPTANTSIPGIQRVERVEDNLSLCTLRFVQTLQSSVSCSCDVILQDQENADFDLNELCITIAIRRSLLH